MKTKPALLRELLAAATTPLVPGCHDAIGAKLVEAAGFPAVYMSGFCVAASHGHPDVGLVTASDMIERARAIACSVSIPLIVDADAGYGDLPNVAAAVSAFEAAGVAGLHIEDQVTPKKCGAMAGKQLVPIEDMVAKIRVAQSVRTNPDFVVIARTDAVAVTGLDDAVKRAAAYREAGADAVIVMSLVTPEDMQRVVCSVDGPVIILMAETIRPTIPRTDIRAIGGAMLIYPLTLILSSVAAQRNALQVLREQEDTASLVPSMAKFGEVNNLVGLPEVTALADRFTPARAAE